MNNVKLRWEIVVSEPFAENTYIAWLEGSQHCLLIDPGLDPGRTEQVVDRLGLVPLALLNTHGHSDHIAGNGEAKRVWPHARLIIGEGDAPKLTDPYQNLSAAFGVAIVSPPADQTVREPDRLELAGIQLEVYDTPGHSAGHVVFVCRQVWPYVVFGGDVLFRGSVGRTDFPDGNAAQLFRSIHDKLFVLPEDTLVLPGHGEPTTIGEEMRTNPFVGLSR